VSTPSSVVTFQIPRAASLPQTFISSGFFVNTAQMASYRLFFAALMVQHNVVAVNCRRGCILSLGAGTCVIQCMLSIRDTCGGRALVLSMASRVLLFFDALSGAVRIDSRRIGLLLTVLVGLGSVQVRASAFCVVASAGGLCGSGFLLPVKFSLGFPRLLASVHSISTIACCGELGLAASSPAVQRFEHLTVSLCTNSPLTQAHHRHKLLSEFYLFPGCLRSQMQATRS
jgi:hypothetical protein